MKLNEPTDPLRYKCGHGFSPLECPYEWCGYRELVDAMNSFVKTMDVYLKDPPPPEKEPSVVKSPNPLLDFTGLWKTDKGFFAWVRNWDSDLLEWKVSILNIDKSIEALGTNKGVVIAKTTFDINGYSKPYGKLMLKQRGDETGWPSIPASNLP